MSKLVTTTIVTIANDRVNTLEILDTIKWFEHHTEF